MPDVDGWAAIGELQADPRTARIPVVVLTGHDLRDHLKRAAIAVGARSFLTKPCPPERLEREVAAHINARVDAAARARRAAPGGMTEDRDDLPDPAPELMRAVEAQLHDFLRLSTTYVNKDTLVREFARRIAAECERRPR